MSSLTRFQLSLMMFLEFFIWGSWYVTLGTYLANSLQANGVQIGNAYSAMSIATILSPFAVGLVADRFFAAQRLMGVLHLLGAGLLYWLTTLTNADIFYWGLLAYSLAYAPTLALANTVAFNQMQDPSKEFANVRVWGTVGWIVTGWAIDRVFHLGTDQLGFTFKMAAAASALLGLVSFFLPHTPPKAKGQTVRAVDVLGADALVLLRDRSFLVFFLSSILICIPLSFYYSQTNQFLNEVGMKNATSNMTFGQISEAVFILAIPFFFRRLGVKYMIAVGMLAWLLRFLCFGYGNADARLWMLFAGILLHGVCYDFFFVTGQIYTDSKAGERIKSQAQGMITMATYGIGMWIGTQVSGYVAKANTLPDNTHQWLQIWLVPTYITLAVLAFFLLLFREKQAEKARVLQGA